MKSVFISSTFKDMQAERDCLHEKIFPRLRLVLSEYGEDIQELDLRWGVDTMEMSEEESGHQVMRVCIDAIDRCRPFIIVLLGERYGWVPDESIVSSLHDERVNRWYEKDMSITSLEIRYGALNDDETLRRCVFCFRNPDVISRIDEKHRAFYDAESPLHREKLDALKNKLRAKKDAVILEYDAIWDEKNGCITGLNEFAEKVYAALTAMMREELAGQEVRSPMEQMKAIIKRRKEQYLSAYVPRYRLEENVMSDQAFFHMDYKKRGRDKQNIIDIMHSRSRLTGEAGSGKSALLASIANHLEEAGLHTILYFSGCQGCQSIETLKRFIIYRLEEICGLPHEEPEIQNMDERLRMLSEKAKGKEIYCIIDALDQLFSDNKKVYFNIHELCPDFCYLVSSVPEFPMEDIMKSIRLPGKMPHLTWEERCEIVQCTAGNRGKKLSDGIVDQIVLKSGADNPLYLTMLLQRYFMMDRREFEEAEKIAPGMKGLYLYMESLLKEIPDTPEAMAGYLLDETAKRFESDSFRTVLMLLAVSERGLTEYELVGMFATAGKKFSQIRFQQMVSYLYDVFVTRDDGRWMFAHRLYCESVLQQMTEKDYKNVIGIILDYCEQDPSFLEEEGFHYALRNRHPLGVRVLSQALKWKNSKRVMKLIGELAEERSCVLYFEEMTACVEANTAVEFWHAFYKSDFYEAEEPSGILLAKNVEDLFGREGLTEKMKFQCADMLASYYVFSGDQESGFKYLDIAEEICRKMDEPERSIRMSRIFMTRVCNRGALYLEDNWKKAAEDMSRSTELLIPLRDTEDPEEIIRILLQDVENKLGLIFYYQTYKRKDCTELLEGCLQDIETVRKICKEESMIVDKEKRYDLDSQECCIIAYLSKAWQMQGHYDFAKAKKYAEMALECSRALIREWSTTSVLNQHIFILNLYSGVYKAPWRYPYAKEMLDSMRKIYGNSPSTYWKSHLASALCHFAFLADKAVDERKTLSPDSPEALLEDSKEAWKEGLGLYEELLREGKVTGDYPLYLVRKAEINLKRGELKDALLHASHGLKIISQGLVPEDFLQRERREIQHLNMVAASALYEMNRQQEAYSYAKTGAELAEAEYASSGKVLRQTVKAHLIFARVLYQLRSDEEALEQCRRTMDCHEKRRGSKTEELESDYADIFYIQGRILLSRGEVDRAEECVQEYSNLIGDITEPSAEEIQNKWQHAKLLTLWGDICEARGNYKEASEKMRDGWNMWFEITQFFLTNRQKGFRISQGQSGYYTCEKCRKDSQRLQWSLYCERYSLLRYGEISEDWGFVRNVTAQGEQGVRKNRQKWSLWKLLPFMNEHFKRLDEQYDSDLRSIQGWTYVSGKQAVDHVKTGEALNIKEFEEYLEYYLQLDGKNRIKIALKFVRINEKNLLSWDFNESYASCFSLLTKRIYAELKEAVRRQRHATKTLEYVSEAFELDGDQKEALYHSSGIDDDILCRQSMAQDIMSPFLTMCMIMSKENDNMAVEMVSDMIKREADGLLQDDIASQSKNGIELWIGSLDKRDENSVEKWDISIFRSDVLRFLLSVIDFDFTREYSWKIASLVAAELYLKSKDRTVIRDHLDLIKQKEEEQIDFFLANSLANLSEEERNLPRYKKENFRFEVDRTCVSECIWYFYRQLIRAEGAKWFNEYLTILEKDPGLFRFLSSDIRSKMEKDMQKYYNELPQGRRPIGARLDVFLMETAKSDYLTRLRMLREGRISPR